eukprot:INCI19214.1.p1 GENE.INCI19214.1~~INCI19214.1.p1  ORF type:complete len:6126 (+),score=1170.25 INCI19214.1:309-18686(+)
MRFVNSSRVMHRSILLLLLLVLAPPATRSISAGDVNNAAEYASDLGLGLEIDLGVAGRRGLAIVTTCAPGQWLNSTTCVSCPAGFACDGSDTRVECGSGYYAVGSAFNCSACPAGSSCATADAFPVVCQDGQYSEEGDPICHDCDPGFYCPAPHLGTLPCPSGSWAAGNATACTVCSAGSQCTSSSTSPCAANTYSFEGSSACLACPDGHFCPVADQAPLLCPLGTYLLHSGAGENCTLCEAGFYCPRPDQAPLACPERTYSAAGAVACLPCPAGSNCTGNTPADINECPTGTYSLAGALACTECEAGFQCSQVASTPCEPGTFSLGRATSCTDCPAGSFCATRTAEPVACVAGYFSLANSVACTACPAGFSCPSDTSDGRIECEPGWFSIAGNSECTECVAGNYCPFTYAATETACPSGFFSAAGQDVCHPCRGGFQCNAAQTAEVACAAGQYSPPAEGSCLSCPADRICPEPAMAYPKECESVGDYVVNSTHCAPCPSGNFCPTPDVVTACPEHYYSDDAALACTLCDPGYLCLGTGNMDAQGTTVYPDNAGQSALCPVGYWCNPSDSQTACPSGMYGVKEGGTSMDDACDPCPAGYMCDYNSGSDTHTMVECTRGHYCPLGTQTATAVPCRSGTYIDSAMDSDGFDFNDDEADCVPCPATFFCPESADGSGRGSDTYYTCPTGYYCPIGTQYGYQFPCPAGKFNDQTGRSEENQCQDCTPGHYCPQAASYQTACEPGTYNPFANGTGIQSCFECTPGYACPLAAMTDSTLYPCEDGYYCPPGTVWTKDFPCPAGKFTLQTNLSREEDCETCPPGMACPLGTGIDEPRQDCAVGHYCPAGTKYPTQYDCPPGTYTDSTNLTHSSECTTCDAGYYCEGGGITPTDVLNNDFVADECAPGYYCPAGSMSMYEVPCPAGTYNDQPRMPHIDNCTDCPVGHYCPEGSANPIECFAGSFANVTNTEGPGILGNFAARYDAIDEGISNCKLCPQGYECATATDEPVACLAGEYSGDGFSDCLPCQAGHFCLGATGVDWMVNNASCPAGLYCAEGHATVPESPADDCWLGHYCPEGTEWPVECPVGTYMNETGASACHTCDAGHYCIEGQIFVNESTKCDRGYFCPAGSSGPEQEPCPGGFWTGVAGTVSEAACEACTEGFYCPPASFVELDCPAGSYCPAESPEPLPCPAGKFGDSENLAASGDCTACTPGYYCGAEGLLSPTGPCDAGYYCDLSHQFPDPVNGICPVGHHCEAGFHEPQPCANGTYSDVEGLEQCNVCPAGHYCDTTQVIDVCPLNYYCPSGTMTAIQCPTGFYTQHTAATECEECPEGFFCEAVPSVNTSITVCPQGHYCPAQSIEPKPCPGGKYLGAEAQTNASDCLACPPGYYCDESALSAPKGLCSPGYYCTSLSETATPTGEAFGDVCPAGKYCPEGAAEPQACPAGKYNPNVGSSAPGNCSLCEAGYYCGENATTYVGSDCPSGYFCPAGTKTATENACPEGTYTGRDGTGTLLSRRTSQADCLPCPGGDYCEGVGNGDTDGPCDAGYFCIGNATTATPTDGITGGNCETGEVCPAGSTLPEFCDAGEYCPNGTSAGKCAAGYYCVTSSSTPYPNGTYDSAGNFIGDECPVGHQCPAGAVSPDLCPGGTFNPAKRVEACAICPPGSYCPSGGTLTPLPCPPRYYCPENTTNFESFPCTNGSYCPGNTSAPVPCRGGTYQPNAATNVCDECPAGNFCPLNSVEPTPCIVGHYCPASVEAPLVCPDGSHSNVTGAATCTECPPGYYCDSRDGSESLVNGTLCTAGYYCPFNTSFASRVACPVGTYGPVTGLALESQCTVCDPGAFCDTLAATSVAGNCQAGYYCTGGAATATPSDDLEASGGACGSPVCSVNSTFSGRECQAGYYCPTGSSAGTPCPPGTFSNSTQAASNTTCLQCTAGYFCPDFHMTAPVAFCPAGFYCPGGQITGAEYPCEEGRYCPEASHAPIACAPGYHQNVTQMSNCSTCPAGRYCDGQSEAALVDGLACPPGYYCPEGTKDFSLFPCPAGTFSNATKLVNASQCLPCTAGFYCETEHLVEPTGPCSAGHYCLEGSDTPTPGLDGPYMLSCIDACPGSEAMGSVCPPGYFCPEGSAAPEPCLNGTFSNSSFLTSASECSACTPGFACPTLGETTPSVICPAGYYCTGGQITGAELPCPAGSFCPEGQASPLPCGAGLRQESNGSSSCDTCPAGYYCTGAAGDFTTRTSGHICPAGSYCPNGSTGPIQYRCPEGTFSTSQGLQNASQCTSCTAGYYCGEEGLTAVSGPCAPGYTCSGGSSTATPTDGVVGDECLAGRYCPEGSSIGTRCPQHTFSTLRALNNVTQCSPCGEGLHCNGTGLTAATGPCPPGYFCPGGAPVLCREGAFCEGGNIEPVDCPQETMQPLPGQTNCTECLAGRYCDGTRDFVNGTDCPTGSYCPAGSAAPEPCPAGTFNDRKNQVSEFEACLVCPERYFCARGSDNYTGTPCPPGYFCPNGTAVSTANPCPIGTFSSVGLLGDAAECTDCTLGYACTTSGLTNPDEPCAAGFFCSPAGQTAPDTPSQTCSAGYVCVGGSYTPTPTPVSGGGYICPAGFYCPAGTTTALACPAGTYSTTEGGVAETSCLACPAGRICESAGMNHTDPCPLGYFCPEGSSTGTPCPNGKYGHQQNLVRAGQCALCPGGSYCTGGFIAGDCEAGYVCYQSASTSNFEFPCAEIYNEEQLQAMYNCTGEPCPQGYFCPKGTNIPLPCPDGTYRQDVRGEHWRNCTTCTPGFYCLEGTQDPLECPPGSFCPLGSSVPEPCPVGTYSNVAGLETENDCTPCPDGYDCKGTNLTTYENYPCALGSFCVGGSAYGCPAGTYGGGAGYADPSECDECPSGNYCPYVNGTVGTVTPIPCDPGFICPPGSGEQSECPIGYYCADALSKVVCPAGYYCPAGTASPILCDKPGTYCPERSFQELICLNGTIMEPKQISADAGLTINVSDLVLSSQNNSCRDCPPGTFQPYWDVNRSSCEACHAGYICTGRTTNPQPLIRYAESWYGTEIDQDFFMPSRDDPTWAGYICPRGHYCKAAAVSEVACPAGTYQPDLGAQNASDCLECPAGKYSSTAGSEACFDCPASSVSDAGSSTCKCWGANRVYQPSDESCVCAPEYVIAAGDPALSDQDGITACEPRVLQVCDSGLRDHTGLCCGDLRSCCVEACPEAGGTLNSVSGQCVCDRRPANLDEAFEKAGCDSTCQRNQPTMHFDCEAQVMFMRTADGDELYEGADNDFEVEGDVYYEQNLADMACCSSDAGCSVVAVRMNNDGTAEGVVGFVPDDALVSRRHLSGRSLREAQVRRHLTTSLANQVPITTPVICILAGDSLVFDIDANGTNGTAAFPEYHKDSLLNSNPNFDYGAFRRLAQIAANTSMFVFPFPDGGVYVFWDGSSVQSQSIVVVQPVGSQCPAGSGSIYPLSTTTLASLGLVLVDDNVTLAADWTLIIVALCALVVLIILFLSVTCAVHRRRWSTWSAPEALFRIDAQEVPLQMYHSKGTFLRRVMPAADREVFEDAEAAKRKAKKSGDEAWNLDELSVQELLERLQYHHNTVKRSFEKDESDVRNIIDNIRDEADTLKRMLATASITEMDANEELLEFIDKMEHELTARNVFDTRLSTAEEDLAAALNDLYDHLGPDGPKPPAHDISEEMAESKPPDNYSDTLDILLDLVQSTYKFSRATVRVIDAEEHRRNQAKLRNPRDKDLLASMNALRSTERNTWDSIDALGKGLAIYAASVANSPDALANVEEDMKAELAGGVPASRLREITEVFAKKFLYPTETVHSAIHALLDIYADVQAELGELRDVEMERRQNLATLMAEKRRELEAAMKKAGQATSDKDGTKITFDGDVEKFVAAKEEEDQGELQQLLQLHGDRAMLEETSRMAEARAQVLQDATNAALTDSDTRQLLNAFQLDQQSLGANLLQEQKLAKAKALRRFERLKQDRLNKNSRTALKERANTAKARHAEELALLKDEFASQALEKLEASKLESTQLAESQQRALQASTELFGTEEAARLKLLADQELLQLESPDHKLGDTLKAEQANQLRRTEARVTAVFSDLKDRVHAATAELVALVEADTTIAPEERRHMLEDIRAEEKLEIQRLEDEAARIVNDEKKRLAQLVKDLDADDAMTPAEKLQEMHDQELEAVRLFGTEAHMQLQTLLETEKNQGVLTTQSLVKARERTTKAALDDELAALVQAKETDFEQEEADLLAALGDDDDDWWEDTLTRAVVTEHENDNSEWDILQEDHKKKTAARKQEQDRELKRLDEEFSAEEQEAIEGLSKEFADKLSMHELKLQQVREELGPNASEAEFHRALAERGLKDLDAFKIELDKGKRLKKTHILQRLEERREHKARSLKSQHEAQLKQAEEEFLKEKLALKVMKARQAEVRVLKATLEQGIVAPKDVGRAIEKAFEMRHGAEFTSLIVQQAEEQSAALKKELAGLFDRKNRERVQLLEQLKQNGVDEQGKKQALAALDERYDQLRKEKMEELMGTMRKKHFDEQVQLKQEQLQEVAAAFKELAPVEVQEEFGKIEAKRLAQSMQEFVNDLKMDSELDRGDADASLTLARKEAEESRRAQAAREEAELSRKLDDRKAQMLAEQERKKAQMLAGSDLDAAQREKIMMQFEADKRRIESAIEKERKRQQKRLQKLLDARNARAAKLDGTAAATAVAGTADGKTTEELMKEIFDNSGEAGAAGLSGIKASTKVAVDGQAPNGESTAAKAADAELAQASSEEELARIEEKFRAQVKSQDARMKAEAARRKKQLEERRAKAKKDRDRLRELKERAAAETDASRKKLLEDQAMALEKELQSDEDRLKEIEADFRKAEESQAAALLAQKKRQREKLKQRREQLKKEKQLKKAGEGGDSENKSADVTTANTPAAQSKTLLGRLDDVEEAIRNLLGRKTEFALHGGTGDGAVGDRDGLPSALADKSDVLSRLDDLQKAVDQESDDEDAHSEAGSELGNFDDELELLEVAPMHESKQQAASLEEEVEARKKGLDQLRAALAGEDDPAKRAALEAAIAEEEDRLRQIQEAYEKAQAEHDKSMEAQQASAKDKLRKRREALAAKQAAARQTRENAKEAVGLKSAEVESLQAVLAEELDPMRRQELEKELASAQVSLAETEAVHAKAIADADDEAAKAAKTLKGIEDEYERSLDQHAKNMESESATKKARLEARKTAREEARAQKRAAAEAAAAAAAEKDAAAAAVASLATEVENEKDASKKQELEQKLLSQQRHLADKEKAAASAAEREAAEEAKLKQIEQDFADASAKYDESVRVARAQQKEKLRLRRERAKQLREQKLAAQQAANDAQVLGASASSDAVRDELLSNAAAHGEALELLDAQLAGVESELTTVTAEVEAVENAQAEQLAQDRAVMQAQLEARKEQVRQRQRALFKEEDREAALEKQLAATKDPSKRAEVLAALEAQRAKVRAQESALQDEEFALHSDLAALRQNATNSKEQQKEQLRLARERKRGLHAEIDQATQAQLQQQSAVEDTLGAVDALETDALAQEGDSIGEDLSVQLAEAKAAGDEAQAAQLSEQLAANSKKVNAAKAEVLAKKDAARKQRRAALDNLDACATGLANWMLREDAALDELQERLVTETDDTKRAALQKEDSTRRAKFKADEQKRRGELRSAQAVADKLQQAHLQAVQKENAERVRKLEARRATAKQLHAENQKVAEQARAAGADDKPAAAKAKQYAARVAALDRKLGALEAIDSKVRPLLDHRDETSVKASKSKQVAAVKAGELLRLILDEGATASSAAAKAGASSADLASTEQQVQLAEEQRQRLQDRLDSEKARVEALAKQLGDTEDEAQAVALKQELEGREARLKGIQDQYAAAQTARQQQLDEEAALRKEKLRKRREAAKAKKAEIERLRAAGADVSSEEQVLSDLHRDVDALEKEEGAHLEAADRARAAAEKAAAKRAAQSGLSDVERLRALSNEVANKRARIAELAAVVASPDTSQADRDAAASELAKLEDAVARDEAALAALAAAYSRSQDVDEQASNDKRLQQAERLKLLKDKARSKREEAVAQKQALQGLLLGHRLFTLASGFILQKLQAFRLLQALVVRGLLVHIL